MASSLRSRALKEMFLGPRRLGLLLAMLALIPANPASQTLRSGPSASVRPVLEESWTPDRTASNQEPDPHTSPEPESVQRYAAPEPTFPAESPTYEYKYPQLRFFAARIGGLVYAGPSASAANGCASLDATVEGNEISVKGMRYPIGVGCTANVPIRWKPLQIEAGSTLISVLYRGSRGRYLVSSKEGRLDITLESGSDLAPPMSSAGWWEVPADALLMDIVNVSGEAALKRSVDRMNLRLSASGAKRMEVPNGEPLLIHHSVDLIGRAYLDRTSFLESLTQTKYQASYRSALSDEALKTMAESETRLEPCTFIMFRRLRDAFFSVVNSSSDCR